GAGPWKTPARNPARYRRALSQHGALVLKCKLPRRALLGRTYKNHRSSNVSPRPFKKIAPLPQTDPRISLRFQIPAQLGVAGWQSQFYVNAVRQLSEEPRT